MASQLSLGKLRLVALEDGYFEPPVEIMFPSWDPAAVDPAGAGVDSEGRLRMPDPPVRFARTPAEIRRLPPRLGEHSVEVLKEAGLAESDIAALIAEGATVAPEAS